MFHVSFGWLRYTPHAHFQLPQIERVTDVVVTEARNDGRRPVPHSVQEVNVTVPVCDFSGNIKFTRPLYRLRWPGQYPFSQAPEVKFVLRDEIPNEIIESWGQGREQWWEDREDAEGISLKELLSHPELPLPEVLPDAVTYHLAVNAHVYHPVEAQKIPEQYPHPVGALDCYRLHEVLDARFALDDHALSALTYLKWVAEGHWPHPLLNSFDTMVREHLLALAQTCVQTYFWLLQDYLYDSGTRYWVKGENKRHWWQLAGYLFWLGRTGVGRVADLAGIEPLEAARAKRFQEQFPDVLERLHQWELDRKRRGMAHITGDYGMAAGDEPPEKEGITPPVLGEPLP